MAIYCRRKNHALNNEVNVNNSMSKYQERILDHDNDEMGSTNNATIIASSQEHGGTVTSEL